MKLKLLPSTFEPDGAASNRQHLTSFVLNGRVAVDAGSLAMAVSPSERGRIRDVVITHAHLDHIAGLPLFVDDQFSELTEAVRVHATREVIDILERDVFNWSVYPKFSELENAHGKVLEYRPFEPGGKFRIDDLEFESVEVNHKVPSSGFIISDPSASIALTGDTANMDTFWDAVAGRNLAALLIECAFPNDLAELAEMSCHLTPSGLAAELRKFKDERCEVFVVNIKPSYREKVLREIAELNLGKVKPLEVGRTYEWSGESLRQAT